MAKSKIKVKIVEYTNNLLTGKPRQFKPALQTPTVVSSEKFIENIAKETGLSRFQAANVLSCIFQTAGDYMELGNAVQLHEDFGTLKPYLKVKSVNEKEKCNADCIQGIGLRLIPTGKMRTILGGVQYTITGMSSGGDVEDSEVVNPDDPNGSNGGGNTGGNGGGNGNTGGQNQTQEPTKYRITFKFSDNTQDDHEYAAGETINYPTPTSGYKWPDSKPTVMPAENVTVTEEVDDDEIPEGEDNF